MNLADSTKKIPYAMVDPPTEFDTLETWEAFQKQIQAWPDNAMLRDELLKEAQETIERKKNPAS